MANQSGSESCVTHREVWGEALTSETGGPAMEPRNQKTGMQMLLNKAEGNTGRDVNRKSCPHPARSKTLCTPGSLLHGSWEISPVPDAHVSGGTGKAKSRNPVAHADEKSDTPVVPKKPSNKGDDPAEVVKGRGVSTRWRSARQPARFIRLQALPPCPCTSRLRRSSSPTTDDFAKHR